ncbi:MAG: FMN-binding protein [Rubrivivax sp.]
MRFVPLAAATALAPAAAFAVDYLSAEQAAKLLFPEATRFEARELSLDAAALQRLQAQGVSARSQHWRVQAALAGADLLGWVVVDDVIGKFELISYAVGITREGRLKPVEVLSYRESHGHEIRLPAWRRQFEGKTAAAPLRVGDDIANISGATLSCTHVTDGVRRIAVLVDWARREGRL